MKSLLLLVVLLALPMTSCKDDSGLHECPDGSFCAAGTNCVLDEDQTLMEGSDIYICTASDCGNLRYDMGEECDLGPYNSNLPNAKCRADCTLADCGDGILDDGEECDDGINNSYPDDPLNPAAIPNTCRAYLNTDNIALPNGFVPAHICRLPACGDGIVDDAAPYNEECDDGNTDDSDGCSSTCTVE